jgi:hypothetical protein
MIASISNQDLRFARISVEHERAGPGPPLLWQGYQSGECIPSKLDSYGIDDEIDDRA